MKLRYKRSGGIANITTRAELDLSKIPAKKARELRDLVDKAHVRELPSLERKSQSSDEFQHDLEIEEKGKSLKIRRNDSQCDPRLLKLFDRLQKEAIRKKK